jgi:hypothetical protein
MVRTAALTPGPAEAAAGAMAATAARAASVFIDPSLICLP